MRKFLLALTIMMAAATLVTADTIYLRDGRTIQGTVLGFVNGRFVVRVDARVSTTTTETDTRRRADNNIQYFRPDEIERIEIEGRSLDDARYQTKNVQVALDSNWVDSGVYLRRGEKVMVTATGVISVGRNRIPPDGLRTTDPSAPLPNVAEGKLIGAIGDDSRAPIIELGASREFVADRQGRLFLTANRSSYTDARGAFDVQIRRERHTTATDDGFDPPGGVRSRNAGRGERPRTPEEVTINVPGNARAADTGIDVRAGDQITFTATGNIIAGQRAGQVGPDGGRTSGFSSVVNTRPVPTAGVGALIGFVRVGTGQSGQPFLIGSQQTYTVQTDGRLYLGINDDNFNDNSGSFTVIIRR